MPEKGTEEPEDEDKNGEQQTPPAPEGSTIFVEPKTLFTSAYVQYTDGKTDSVEVQSGAIVVPKESNGKTIYSISFSPKGTNILIGRKAGEEINLKFNDEGTQLEYRYGDNGLGGKPVLIGSYQELIKIRDAFDKTKLDSGKVKSQYVDIIQDGDIDLFGSNIYKNGVYRTWQPIGTIVNGEANGGVSEGDVLFTATYEGNGKKILNMKIETDQNFQGFFAGIGVHESGTKGKVRNLIIQNSYVESGDTSGILTGINMGIIENCIVRDSTITRALVAGKGRSLGGICGSNISGGEITASYFIGKVEGFDTLGGIAGVNNGAIMGCWHFGDVLIYIGGSGADSRHIAGRITGGGKMYCYWFGNIDNNGAQIIDTEDVQFSAAQWPYFPSDNDTNADAPWSEYRMRDSKVSGRWESIGTPSDTPTRNTLPKLWFDR
ncbi:MAG: hypothetical protein LBG72_04300 [Spirochaetaceae bacterium]|nr:hypothetical protein [Spirochaetaceae bacterium]